MTYRLLAGGGEPGETLIKGGIVRSFLDADFRFALVRTYTEPPRPKTSRSISALQTEMIQQRLLSHIPERWR